MGSCWWCFCFIARVGGGDVSIVSEVFSVDLPKHNPIYHEYPEPRRLKG
jgi:hypothetical protein